MAEIIQEGIYTATIEDTPGGAQETFMVVQPPADIQPGLWARCLAHTLTSSEDDLDTYATEIRNNKALLELLGSSEEGSLYAVEVTPFHVPAEDTDEYFPPAVLRATASHALKALMLTRGQIDSEALYEQSNNLAI